MCGIGGKLYFDPARPVEREVLERMNVVQAHRGPDDAGIYCQGSVGLAHRRLCIIDLSPAGHQPMPNEDGTVWIVFNGEIYNFQDLRPDLLRRGHRFRSRTDTEVILHLYEEYGVDCLRFLRGMFALAIWDASRRQLFLARDRLGVKPLAYQCDAEAFRFASEVKAILQDPSVEVRPDPAGISQYLTYGVVPAPGSAFQGVRKLPPAHYLICRDGQVEVVRYWRLRRDRKRERPEAEWCQEILARLEEAVRLRLISDVPLGAFLSGGVDSSAVVAMMSHASRGAIKTFSIGFEEADYDELRYARLVAQRFGTDHHELVVRPDAAAILPRLAWHYDEPFGDSSAVPTYYVAQMTRQYVTVALNGDAGDENFGGYDRYVATRLATAFDHALAWPGADLFRRAIRMGLRVWPQRGRRRSPLSRGRRFLEGMTEPPERRYARWLCPFSDGQRGDLLSAEFRAAIGEDDPLEVLLAAYRESDAPDLVDATLGVDAALYLPDDLLVKVDIASMAHSLEARSPFLDHEFMEFAATIPSHLKVRGRAKKLILKRALAGLLPEEILRRPKMGFGVPIDHWLRHELRDLAHETLLGPRCLHRGYFRREVVQRLMDEHARGAAGWHEQLWTLLMLELWHRTYVDGDGELARQRRTCASLAAPVTG
ncbi:MAG: asparagine synthase (glutamine-hydrolyzing) [candidate division NC10 bacterium RIFCSPLOWO2_12_FULL_66_18]|nr:MAG: asparagine synthase (glutamine-hydrolyzing) [candidate division NC10 bacterium RIFCSPLOWO2_12_FULL_66_18]